MRPIKDSSISNLSNTSSSLPTLEANSSSNEPVYSSGDITFIIIFSVLLWMIVPGTGLVYNGGVRAKNALTLLMLSLYSTCIVTLQWWAFGYSLVFSTTGGFLIGNFDKIFLRGVYNKPMEPETSIPELGVCLYQGVTATICPALIFGIISERGRILPAILFTLIWTTFVYDFVAYWSLNPNGWCYKMGVLDFGGGAPVHVPLGAAGLAYSFLLGPIKRSEKYEIDKPHNLNNVVLGTFFVWIASFGYNGGSGNIIALTASVAANIAGSAGGVTWALIDYIKYRNFPPMGFCLGCLCGLVIITPASGFISPSSSVAIGVIGTAICNFVYTFRKKFLFEDVMEVFIINGIGGFTGNILTGVFAQSQYEGVSLDARGGGWMDGNWNKVLIQIINSCATFTWSLVISFLVLFLMNKTKWLRLRVSEKEEENGIDLTELGISGYEFLDEFYSVEKEANKLKQFVPVRLIENEKIKSISAKGVKGDIKSNKPPLIDNWILN